MENKISVLPNGPILIEGTIQINLPDGQVETKENKTFLCRCGHSSKKPYCDGSHKKQGFIG